MPTVAAFTFLYPWTFGTILVPTPGVLRWSAGWWHVKLTCLLLMSAYHGEISRWRRAFARGRNTRSARFYKLVAGVPAFLVAVIIVMVIVRPF